MSPVLLVARAALPTVRMEDFIVVAGRDLHTRDQHHRPRRVLLEHVAMRWLGNVIDHPRRTVAHLVNQRPLQLERRVDHLGRQLNAARIDCR